MAESGLDCCPHDASNSKPPDGLRQPGGQHREPKSNALSKKFERYDFAEDNVTLTNEDFDRRKPLYN